jgi:hypothetical protein
VRIDEGHGVCMHDVGHVLGVCEGELLRVDVVGAGLGAHAAFAFLVAFELILLHPLPSRLFVPVDAAGLEAEHVVKAPLRRISRRQNLPPFADHRGGVAGFLEHGGHHDLRLVSGARDHAAAILRDGPGAEAVAPGENERT